MLRFMYRNNLLSAAHCIISHKIHYLKTSLDIMIYCNGYSSTQFGMKIETVLFFYYDSQKIFLKIKGIVV